MLGLMPLNVSVSNQQCCTFIQFPDLYEELLKIETLKRYTFESHVIVNLLLYNIPNRCGTNS